ncbi:MULTISPECIES: MFS transporter [Mycobacterium]|uniref:MFS transporter n=1 Tax=Mycobacterium kiyosense TaxID=2871094 RepID=A0A9P3QCM7_9MYCO|nr:MULTISPECIES: MFS transporter [Mycobacterium]BDE13913.1 MFS transporter [Mycobacterium sp. 20KCMC460]GLB84635.1 MFS transporter [Mycobacterium kiyosense]GLB91914.1 MFS transporter [Mycobacterium kiyosense]GLB97983.1 MFS transporter [Mycobacterium kiyosense]GLC03743.1 MFS transporter [Mycobacterium kiyosense]
MTQTARATGSWRDLLGHHLGTCTVLAGGVAMYATNEFLTVSLLPSAIAEIGGSRLYAWVVTLYLVGSVAAATTVNATLRQFGARVSFLLGLSVFGVASLVCAVAPTMQVLIAGRTLQGVAGGLLAGLGYALINAELPRELWTRGSALVSAMWGVATVVGPAIGGVFAQYGLWRWAFGTMTVLSVLMAALVTAVLGAERAVAAGEHSTRQVPVWSLLVIGAAALAVSVAQLPRNAAAIAGLVFLGLLLVAAFIAVDRRKQAKVLPPSVFGSGPLKWIYLTMAMLMMAVMVDTYVPLFGQRLGHLSPVGAGFLGASLAVGWTVSEVVSASLHNRRVIGYVVLVAPLLMGTGLAVGALTQSADASPSLVGLWALALVIAGIGIGMAWPHMSVRAMESVDDPAESSAAAAAINTVQLISGAFGAGIAGVVVNTAPGDAVIQARWLYAVFTVLAAVGVLAAYRATRRDRRSLR